MEIRGSSSAKETPSTTAPIAGVRREMVMLIARIMPWLGIRGKTAPPTARAPFACGRLRAPEACVMHRPACKPITDTPVDGFSYPAAGSPYDKYNRRSKMANYLTVIHECKDY